MRSDAVPDRDRRAVLRGAGALGVLALGQLVPDRAYARRLVAGEPAPPAVLVSLDGERVATRDLLGHVVILTFWATWCVPCREELPLLSEYAREHAARGLRVLGFTLDSADRLDAVRSVARSLAFPVGFLAEDSAPGYGRIWRLPVNFTIGRDGTLLDNGWKDKQPAWTRERLERIVSPLLA